MADDADLRITEGAKKRAHFAVLTPTGRGAIATVAVRGKDVARVVGRRFTGAGGKLLAEFPIGRAIFGRFRTAADCEEELVIGLVTPDQVEIHCHGGRAAVAAICQALADEGCVQIEPAEWLEGQVDHPLAAEALLALSRSRTERTAAVLLDQLRGALARELERIDELVVVGNHPAANGAIKSLLARAEFGLHLTTPWHVAIAGRPNAGKSSLMNALVGYERAIVFAEPGTTRDVLTASTAIDGWPIDLVDTAGLRSSSQKIEAEGIARAERQIAAADLVLLVADLTEPWDGELLRRMKEIPATRDVSPTPPRLLIVHNKRDLVSRLPDDRPTGILVSARTGEGIRTLCQAVCQSLVPPPPQTGDAVPFDERHIRGLTAAARHLAQGNVELARQAIRGLVGPALPGTASP